MSRFFDIDSTRVSHLEYWWGTRNPFVIIGWITKWLRIKIPSSTDDPNVESTTPFVTESLPSEVLERFAPLISELSALDFHPVVNHCIHDPGTQTTYYWSTFVHSSGNHFARIHHRVWQKSSNPHGILFPMFFTAFADGTFLVSSSGKPDVAAPGTVAMNRKYKMSTTQLWAAHQEMVESVGRQKNIARVELPEETIAAVERHHVLVRDFHLHRGVFRERTAENQRAADAFAARVDAARQEGLEHGEILAELDRLQDKKPSWKAAIWILVISIIVFIAAGAARWNWKLTAIVVAVLFFHEAGHWLAMRLFKYRNVRMFFIPLFGAAVIGRNWNVPGWKKAVVSLAGPIPGIVVGTALAIAGFVTDLKLLLEIGLFSVIINGFNLLPLLPLDGGHVLHATLFCRNRWLDIAFRIAAIAGLLLLGIFASKIFLYIGIALGITLPISFKLGKITDDLRAQQLPPPTPGEDRIPTRTAQAIISAVKEVFPKRANNKVIAQHTINVFETLNARPPGVVATIALLLTHGGAAFVSIVVGVLLLVNRHGSISDFMEAAARQPAYAISCDEIVSWNTSVRAPSDDATLLIATFDNHSDALEALTKLTNAAPDDASMIVFGQSLMLTVPGGDGPREKWFEELHGNWTTNLVTLASNAPVMVELFFIAPTSEAATNLEEELKLSINAINDIALVPPWSPDAQKKEFESHRRARRDWARLDTATTAVWTNASMNELRKRMGAAYKRGARAEAERLMQEQYQMGQDLARQAREQLGTGTGAIDAKLIDLYDQMNDLSNTNETSRAALQHDLASALGGVPFDAEKPMPASLAHCARSGFVYRSGLLIEVRWAVFDNATTGVPAMVRWLCNQQSTGFKYSFYSTD